MPESKLKTNTILQVELADGTVQRVLVNGAVGQVIGTSTTYSADGAVALTDEVAILDGSTATVAISLADGTIGQVITLVAIDVTNNPVLTPANFANGNTITFDAANEYAIILFNGSDWVSIGTNATIA